MRDGLYQVTTNQICAGFIVRHGRIVETAPILRRKINYWMRLARWISA